MNLRPGTWGDSKRSVTTFLSIMLVIFFPSCENANGTCDFEEFPLSKFSNIVNSKILFEESIGTWCKTLKRVWGKVKQLFEAFVFMLFVYGIIQVQFELTLAGFLGGVGAFTSAFTFGTCVCHI